MDKKIMSINNTAPSASRLNIHKKIPINESVKGGQFELIQKKLFIDPREKLSRFLPYKNASVR
jgi:hypothetical protein